MNGCRTNILEFNKFAKTNKLIMQSEKYLFISTLISSAMNQGHMESYALGFLQILIRDNLVEILHVFKIYIKY